MRVTLLGTGTPEPDPKRAGQSFVVTADDDHLLFDCGPGATCRAVEAGIPITDIDYVFLTHHHFDHIADLPFFVLSRWDQGADAVNQLRIFGPPPTERMCHQLFGEGGVYDIDITSRVLDPVSVALYWSRGGSGDRPRPRPMVQDAYPGVVWSTHKWIVEATPVSHSEYMRCYAYKVTIGNRSLVISGDTVPCRSVVELARDADLLIHMAISNPHTSRASASPEDAAQVAAAASVKQLVLVHLGSQIDKPEYESTLREKVSEIYTGPLVLGRDGMVVSTGGPEDANV